MCPPKPVRDPKQGLFSKHPSVSKSLAAYLKMYKERVEAKGLRCKEGPVEIVMLFRFENIQKQYSGYTMTYDRFVFRKIVPGSKPEEAALHEITRFKLDIAIAARNNKDVARFMENEPKLRLPQKVEEFLRS